MKQTRKNQTRKNQTRKNQVWSKSFANPMFAMAVTVLLAVMILCIMGTVKVMAADAGQKEQTAYYLGWKEGYVNQVRAYLAEEGYRNSGVMVARTREAGRCRYCVSVHHSKVENTKESDLKLLAARIEGMAADMGSDNVVCVFR